jgi:surface antigen
MKNISKLLLITFIGFSLQSCESMNKQGGGTLIGGVTGGLLGSQFGKGEGQLLATGIGALAGALVGGQVGKTMDEYDKQMLVKSSHQALEFSPSGNRVEWRNPDNGNNGSITPTKSFKEDGRYCREYIQEVIIGGEKEKAYGKACRQPDGNWKIIK